MTHIIPMLPVTSEEFDYFKEAMVKVNEEFKLVYWSTPEGVAKQVATIFKVREEELDAYILKVIKEDAVRQDTERAVRTSLEQGNAIEGNTEKELLEAFDRKWPWIVAGIAGNFLVHITGMLVFLLVVEALHLFGWVFWGTVVLFAVACFVDEVKDGVANWLAWSLGTTRRW